MEYNDYARDPKTQKRVKTIPCRGTDLVPLTTASSSWPRKFFERARNGLLEFYFQSLMYTFGVACGFSSPQLAARCVQVFASACLIPLVYIQVCEIIRPIHAEEDAFSCTDLAFAANNIISILVIIQILLLFTTRRRILEELLMSEPLDPSLMSTAFLLNLPLEISNYFYITVKSQNRSYIYLAYELAAAYVWRILISFDICYLQLMNVLQSRQQRLLCLLRQPLTDNNVRYLIHQKWAVRDTTELVNKLCGTTLPLYYMKIFFSIICSAGNISCRHILDMRVYSLAFAHISYILVLTLIAHQGSRLISSCIEGHSMASRLPKTTMSGSDTSELREVLKYKKKWDCLTMSLGFIIEMPVLISFLGTCITVVAIFLQFDYKVLRKLQQAMQN